MANQTANRSRILIVDDDVGTREALEVILEDDYDVVCVADGQVALDQLNREAFDLVLLDLIMPGMDGIATLKRIKSNDKQIDVIMVSATDRACEATAAITSGAYDYISKPYEADAILTAIERALEKRSLEQEVRYLRSEVALRFDETRIVGESQPMKALDINSRFEDNSSTYTFFSMSFQKQTRCTRLCAPLTRDHFSNPACLKKNQ